MAMAAGQQALAEAWEGRFLLCLGLSAEPGHLPTRQWADLAAALGLTPRPAAASRRA